MEKGEKEVPFFWMEESSKQLSVPMKWKRKVRAKKIEFVGWGSKPLIEFLESIGKETSKQLSQYEVSAVINEYVRGNNLLHPEKKKRVVCDEGLRSIFGKKSVPRIKIYDLLEPHFAENRDESEEELLYSSEENEENVMITFKKPKASSSDQKTPRQKKQVSESPKSCFAAIISENIKLVYLKRSLVQDFLKDPESFEGKVVGSYVRIKSDPNDYFQKNSHQLLQVTGVRKASGCSDAETLLQVPNLITDILISMISDDNFSEEECEDLCQRVKAGLLERPTVVALEQKAQILHEDITKHWLVREIALLQNLIDRANEKGWRRELFEYLERKQLLQTPSEQSRLLLEVPKVIAEELELEVTLQDPSETLLEVPKVIADEVELDATLQDAAEKGNSCSPKSILRGASDISVDLGANQSLSTQNSGSTDATGPRGTVIQSPVVFRDSSVGGEGKRDFITGITSIKDPNDDQHADFIPQQDGPFIVMSSESGAEMQPVNSVENKGCCGMVDKQVTAPQVIELSDDDQDAEDPVAQDQMVAHFPNQIVDHPESSIWYYMDPQGEIQGPFSMAALRRWSDAYFFHPGFMVWKRGQSPDKAVLLSDLLCRMFPN